MVRDPVCYMMIDPAHAAATSEYKGKTYYFCAVGCKKAFDKAPDNFLTAKGEPAMPHNHNHGHDH